MRGPVSGENPGAGTVDILGVTVTGVDGVTAYEDDDDNPINQPQFHTLVQIGTVVEAEWDPFNATGDTADKLAVEDED